MRPRRRGRVDPIDRGGDGGDPAEIADDGAVLGAPVTARRLARGRERRAASSEGEGRGRIGAIYSGDWTGQRVASHRLRPLQLQQHRRPRHRRRQAQHLPLAPEIRQRGHDVHRPEGPRGRAARRQVRRRARAPVRRSAAAISGASPCASAVPTRPLSTSPLPPVASPGLPAATVSGAVPSRAITVGTPLSSTVAPRARRRHRRRPRIELAHAARASGNSVAEFARVRREHHRAPRGQRAQARRPRPETRRARRHRAPPPCAARTSAVDERPASGLAAEPGADHDGVRAARPIRAAAASAADRAVRERLDIGLGLDQRGHRLGRRHDVHQPRARAERRRARPCAPRRSCRRRRRR